MYMECLAIGEALRYFLQLLRQHLVYHYIESVSTEWGAICTNTYPI